MIEIRKIKDTTQSISQPPDLVPVSRDGKLQLSFAQQRMWFLYQLDSSSSFYNGSFQIKIIGALNVTVLEQSVNEIIRRHEVLRTNFPTIKGVPLQAITPTLSITLPVVDLQGLTEAFVQQLVARQVRQPFDLVTGPLLRVTLLLLSPETHLLILTIHHIITDGWSMGIFFKELGTLYQAFTNGEPSPLPELAIQYADFSVWQREWLTGEVMQKQVDYWKQQLADAPPLLKLPTDYPRPLVQTFCGATRLFELDPDLTFQLKTLSKKSGITLFMTLMTAFVTLLYRYSSQKDICVGFPIANRDYSELDPLIGLFVNTLVLRTQIEGNPSFSKLLEKIGHLALDAYAHQNAPFEQVVEALKPERSLGYNPLFQVMFTLDNLSVDTFELPGIKLTPEPIERGIAQFDLSLSIQQTQKGLTGSWEYNSDLFKPNTIARMTGHFQILLEAIVANPDQRVGELCLLTESEKYQLLVEWNNTTKEYSFDKCIHELFEEQVTRSPDAIAVILEGEQLTYRELNKQANRIAHHLRALGVGPEVLVGICLERSPLMVVGLLGILKAGGAYVPLDPAYPSERLAYMLSDSQVKVLLTQEKLASSLPVSAAQVICLHSDWQNIGTHSEENPLTEVKASNLAYVIYTSGSTGKPKGVMIEHRSIVNFTSSAVTIYNITQSDRVLQFASIAFDGAAIEIFPCLSAGGTLVLRTDEMLVSGSRFVQRCREWEITMMDWPTSHWHQVMVELAATEQTLPESLRVVSVGGDAVLPETLKLWQSCVNGLANPPQLLNGYGPTETTAVTTYYELSEFIAKNPAASCVPIGTPIGNVSTYVLNHHLQPVPIGVPGELHIGGLGLARGYLGRPDLTAEKFIPNPFSNEPEARLYKTGDKARYRPDGNIEFLGRIDHQVKIRGFRIELGEIETALCQHPEVRECVVIVRTNESGDKQLVAYVVPKLSKLTASKLRSFLQQQLPNYMVPAAFVVLESLPLTPNGKVDRRALPTPDKSSFTDTGFVAPSNTLERQLAQIWSEILDVELVGVKDNFFALGGHSLLAIRLMAKIQQELGKSLPLATLFQSPTISDLASLIKTEKNVPTNFCLVPIQPKGNKSPFFCVHAVGGEVLCYADLAGYLGPEQPFYALRSLGLDGSCEPLTGIEDMAATYIKALQTIQPEGPYQLGGWSMGGAIAFEMAMQLKTSGQTVSLLALIDSYVPIQKFKGSLLMDEAMLLADWVKTLSGLSNKAFSISAETLRLLEAQEQLNYVLEQAKEVGLLPKEIGHKQGSSLFRVFKANSQAIASYTPQPYLGRITFFYADESMKQNQYPSLGWAAVAAGSITTHNISGNHYSIIESKILAQKLRAYLNG
uniref:Non-ribosomal peptide synthase n=1 Tax=Nostoc sp. 'Peltigera membranacea cyanobiont' TaxID=414689 RepID=M4TNH5_9NOSO|nr:non-ribosomal peptide synthase [Nostoc sp. 'Peltigera membranacea cyanobiont']